MLAGVPAAVGLAGNDSFSRDVPVRVPQQAQTVAPTPVADDDGTADQGPGDVPRDDRTDAGDDDDGTPDQGPGDFPRDDATEDGGHGSNSGPGSDSSGSGSGSGSGDDDHSGSGSGSDDSSGSSGSGSGHD